jgi:hypothetical protein
VTLSSVGGFGYAIAAAKKAGNAAAETFNGNGNGNSSARQQQPTPSQQQYEKTTICHRTGSETNPYVEITVSNNALDAHRTHPPKDGREDIIPAPAGGCPD